MHKSYLTGLSDGQREAVLHREGPMLVTAGPGSGKTHVITTRLIHMIAGCSIPPDRILVITFTKEAAKSMSSRFQKTYQDIFQSAPANVVFGTFHSFYYQIIRSIPKYKSYRLIHENEKKYMMSQIITETEDNEDQTELLLSAVSYYKNTLNLEKASEKADMKPEMFERYMHAYDSVKDRNKCLDFDDMLYLTYELLRGDRELLHKWQKRFQYYLVDEFQDSNPVQYRILRLLVGKGNLFVVGDDDQAIYGFRGADPTVLQRFLQDFPKAKHVTLGLNYRCSVQVVQASRKVVEQNHQRMFKELKAYSTLDKANEVRLMPWQDREQMYQYMRELFGKLPEGELEKHAVFLRTNQETQMFAVHLVKDNIPFRMKDQSMVIYDHFLMKDMMDYLEAAGGNRQRKIFLRILNKPRRNIGRESLDETVDFKKMKEYYSNRYINNPAAVEDIQRLEQQLGQLNRLPLYLAIRFIRNAMGYEKYLQKKSAGNESLLHTWHELLDWLQEDGAQYRTLADWKEAQEVYRRKASAQNPRTEQEKCIHLMTMHASKGLEFDHCHILNINEGTIPKYRKGEKLSAESVEEERRIFYVGMTRAKKTLTLHYLTGTKERPKLPSRFLKPLM